MAQNEIVNIITIKTEESQKTIKGLKKEVSDLKKVLDNAVIGSEDFEQASRDLKVAQNELKAAMTGQKQSVEALDGSYDALVQEMAKLKKEWRATADVVKRNEIGEQIDIINNQLKELDKSIGNHQRNVGNYAGDIKAALGKTQDGIVACASASKSSIEKVDDSVAASAESFKKALAEQDDATITTRTKLESVQKVATGLASGYAALQGVTALLGIENENLEKTLVKVQAAMAIAQGVGGLKDLVEGVSRAKVAFQGALVGCKAFIGGLSGVQKAIIATGIGALVVAIGLLIANWDKLSKMVGHNKKTNEEYAESVKEVVEREKERNNTIGKYVGNAVSKYKLLQHEWNNLKTTQEKTEWVNKNQSAFNDLGIAVNSVVAAQKAFVDNADDVIKVLRLEAEAAALAELYQESFKKTVLKQQELKTKEKTIKSGYVPTEEELKNANINTNWDKIQKEYKGILLNYWYDTGEVNSQGAKKIVDYYKGVIGGQVEELKKESDDIGKQLDAKQKEALAAKKTITGVTFTDGKNGGSSGGSKEKTPFEEALERVKEALKKQADELLTDEEKLDKEYAELLKKLEGNQEAQLLATEWYINEQTKLLEKELDAQIELNNKIAENSRKAAEERIRQDEENYQKEVAASEKRLSSSLGNIEKDAEGKIYRNERKKPSGNGEINAIDNELSKLETLKSITLETEKLKIDAIDREMAKFKESSDRWKELEEEKKRIREQTNRTIEELDDQHLEQTKAKNRALAGSITNTFTSSLQAASQIMGAIQEGIDTTTKEGFERNKKMQIANATIQMLVGITSALAGAFTTKSGPWDIALAAIQAATIATTGGIQIANIKKQTFDGGSSSAVAVPTMGMSDNLPVSYTRNLLGNTEAEEMNAAQKVYILESEIEEAGRKVEIRDNNTNF